MRGTLLLLVLVLLFTARSASAASAFWEITPGELKGAGFRFEITREPRLTILLQPYP